MDSEVSDLIQALRGGSMTLEEVAQRFRQRTWPPSKPPPPANYRELAAAALRDPDPDVPGSFAEVVAAYDRGELTRSEYRFLADAVADAIGRKGERRG